MRELAAGHGATLTVPGKVAEILLDLADASPRASGAIRLTEGGRRNGAGPALIRQESEGDGRAAAWPHVAAECRNCRPTADQTGKPLQMVLVGQPE